jgi:hypothetical protein
VSGWQVSQILSGEYFGCISLKYFLFHMQSIPFESSQYCAFNGPSYIQLCEAYIESMLCATHLFEFKHAPANNASNPYPTHKHCYWLASLAPQEFSCAARVLGKGQQPAATHILTCGHRYRGHVTGSCLWVQEPGRYPH